MAGIARSVAVRLGETASSQGAVTKQQFRSFFRTLPRSTPSVDALETSTTFFPYAEQGTVQVVEAFEA